MKTSRVVFCGVIAAACGSSWADDLRGVTERLLEIMQRAALKGDQEAYFASVHPRDPISQKEQDNWFADVKRNPPMQLTLGVGRGGDLKPWENAISTHAYFEVIATWAMPETPGGTTAGPVRTATYPAEFLLNTDTEQWMYVGEDWLVSESRGDLPSAERAKVKFFPGSEAMARSVVSILPEVGRAVHDLLDVTVRRTQEIKLYQSLAHLQFSIYPSYSEPLTGWSEPGEAIKLLVVPSIPEDRLRRVLAHEYTHMATFELGSHATDMPWWALEGIAELAAERIGGDGGAGGVEMTKADGGKYGATVKQSARDGALVPWEKLADFRGEARNHADHVYAQGCHMLAFIGKTAGDQKRNDWLRELAKGKSLEDATSSALGMTFADLDRKWRDSLAAP